MTGTKILHVDQLRVSVSDSRERMAQLAAAQAAEHIRTAVNRNGVEAVAFAAAPSQTKFLMALREDPSISWEHIIAFQLDEYIGLPDKAPQQFKSYLHHNLFRYISPREVHYLQSTGVSLVSLPPDEACKRYEALLKENPIQLMCIGIGENGHIAFNDRHVANFEDPLSVKPVELDDVARKQQVNDGCFPSLADVPRMAVTMTIPTIMSATGLVCVAPGARKRQAVRRALYGRVTQQCPAAILRTHPNASLFLDRQSGRRRDEENVKTRGASHV